MSRGQVTWNRKRKKWRVRGEFHDSLVGRSSFKQTTRLHGEQKRWIEYNQELFGRELVILRVLHETMWTRVPEGTGMFGSPPWDRGTWNLSELRRLSARGERVERLTQRGRMQLRKLFKLSHKTGCGFEIVIDATLKHAGGLTSDLIDHVIRQVAHDARRFQTQFPNAAIILSARNEWDAHNLTRTRLDQVNDWAKRFYRWKQGRHSRISRTSPGPAWTAEQWPEGFLIVDHGGRNDFDYRCGTNPGVFQMAAIHPERGREWWKGLSPNELWELKRLAKGAPIGYTESMYYLDKEDRERGRKWYNGPDGWTWNLKRYIEFLDSMARQAKYQIVHDEKGVQVDPEWPRRVTKLERHLAERFNGRVGE